MNVLILEIYVTKNEVPFRIVSVANILHPRDNAESLSLGRTRDSPSRHPMEGQRSKQSVWIISSTIRYCSCRVHAHHISHECQIHRRSLSPAILRARKPSCPLVQTNASNYLPLTHASRILTVFFSSDKNQQSIFISWCTFSTDQPSSSAI